MRTLASGIYTHDQVKAQLLSSSFQFSTRYEVLSPALAILGSATTVTAAEIEMNVDRTVKGSLGLTMLADPDLVRKLFQRRIRPWYQIAMPDGGKAEFPMGVYVWNVPARSLPNIGTEEWTLTLGDQGHILDAGGPGPNGFTIAAGERVTDAIIRAVTQIGFTDISGIESSGKVAGQQTTWGLCDDNGIITWTRVLTDLHGSISYYSPWFDGIGRYRATPIPDLKTADTDWSYEPGQYSIIGSAETDEELDAIGNRVFVVASNQGSVFGQATADADVLVSGHPLSRSQIGFYIDKKIDDQVAATVTDLQLRAYSELMQSLSRYQRMTIETTLNPAHEAFDKLRVAWPGDSEMGSGLRWHERRWSVNLFENTMTHDLRRLDN